MTMSGDTTTDDNQRQKRKEEAKKRKRQLIAESGGVRPRKDGVGDIDKNTNKKTARGGAQGAGGRNNEKEFSSSRKDTTNDDIRVKDQKVDHQKQHQHHDGPAARDASNHGRHTQHNNGFPGNQRQPRDNHQHNQQYHRFGRVMDVVPCRNKPRFSTLSIAVPGSVLTNCQTKELRTLLVGQIARAATIYHVDEIIVFDDKLGGKTGGSGDGGRHYHGMNNTAGSNESNNSGITDNDSNTKSPSSSTPNQQHRYPRSDPHEFMARLLQYAECPQYLRRVFFPMHPDLQFAGLLPPIDAPHHVRANDRSKYREGVVMKPKKNNSADGGNSLVNCGIPNRPVEIDRQLTPGIRCTVRIDDVGAYGRPGTIRGTVVSPSTPREDNGTYWGYHTRLATSINDVFNCPFNAVDGKYDLKIGTSERGDKSVETKSFGLPKYRHSLIVFGGVAGIEECVDADESIKLPGSQSSKLFDVWLNTCPFQGSRTIRTEEAVMISLAALNSSLTKSAHDKPPEPPVTLDEDPIEFSDDDPSEESSSSDDDDDDDRGNDKDEDKRIDSDSSEK